MLLSDFLNVTPDPRSGVPTSGVLLDDNTYIGVEVELEGIKINKLSSYCPLLTDTEDFSLRGEAGEILFAFPLKGMDVVTALHAIESYVLSSESTPINSARTSTHVHIDFRDKSMEDLKLFMITYLTVERLLLKYSGQSREDNIFCVPLYKSTSMIRCLADSFANKKESGNRIRNIDDGYRYGALNLNALWKHGTVEFRMLEMEYSASKLLRWVNIILSILKYSAETPKNKILKVTTVYSDKCETYIKNVFGKYAEFLMYKGYERDIMLGSRVARDMIYTPALAKVGAWDLLEAGMYDGVRTTINMGHPSLIVGHDPSVDMTYQVPPLFANMLIDDEEIIDDEF